MNASRHVRAYRLCLRRLLPAPLTREAGDELAETFAAALARARRRGGWAVAALWCRALADLVVTAHAERRSILLDERSPAMSDRFRVWTHDLGVAVRQLRIRPGSALMAAGTLALGIAAALTAAVLVRDLLLAPLPFSEPERLVRLREQSDDGRRYWPSFPTCADWEARATTFTALGCASIPSPQVVLSGERGVMAEVARGTAGLFRALEVRPVAGRLFGAAEHQPGGPPVALVRHGFWRDHLGGESLESLVLTVGRDAVTVVGVLPDDFRMLGDGSAWARADVWMPLETGSNLGGRRSHGYHTIGRLRPGLDLDTADREMASLATVLQAEHGEATHADRAELRPLADVVTASAREPLRLLAWAAFGVLLVAALNFAATLFARGIGRAHEMSVRLSLGARRGDLARLHVAEALVLSVPAALAGVLAAAVAVRALATTHAGVLPRLGEAAFDARAAILGAALAVGCAVLAAALPVALLSARRVAGYLRPRADAGAPGPPRAWRVALAAQVAAALVLLVASGLLVQSFRAAIGVDVGYRADDVLSVAVALPEARYPTPESRRALVLDALRRIDDVPSTRAVSVTNVLPHVTQAVISSTSPADDATTTLWAGIRVVTPEYFDVLGIAVRPESEPWRPDAVYVDEALGRRFWPGQSPVGQALRGGFSDEPIQVAGVVGSVREWNQEPGALGTLYFDYRLTGFDVTAPYLLVRHAGNADAAARDVRQALEAVAPGLPVEIVTLSRLQRDGMSAQQALFELVGAFGVIGLLIACAGIYALVAFSVGRRLREAAIRKAVGARPAQVAATMIRAGLVPAVAGVVVGLGAWVPASRVIGALLFGITPFDPVTLGAASVVLVLAAVLASAVPARRAATVEPVVLLRE